MATELGPVCEGCGERTRNPTWFEMDPFCQPCAADITEPEYGNYGVPWPGTVPVTTAKNEEQTT